MAELSTDRTMADRLADKWYDEWLDECAAVLMGRWGVEDTDEDAYDAARADVEALRAAGLVMAKKAS